MIVSSQLRAGMAIKHEGRGYKVLAAEYHPGQGKMGGVTHTRLQDLNTATLWEHSFRSDLKFEEIALEKQTFEYLYADADRCYFMNAETFEQGEIPRVLLGQRADMLEPGMQVVGELVEGKLISVMFPDILDVRIAETAPATHQQQDSTFKPAKLTSGIEVMVPQFIKTGDRIRLDTQNLKYVERAKADGKMRIA